MAGDLVLQPPTIRHRVLESSDELEALMGLLVIGIILQLIQGLPNENVFFLQNILISQLRARLRVIKRHHVAVGQRRGPARGLLLPAR